MIERTPPLKATLLALTLNEIDGVQAILPRIDRSLLHQLIVVDGGSTDGTAEWCRAHGFDVFVQVAPGLRRAYTEVLPHVSGDVIVTMSPDGNCPPEAVGALLAKIAGGYDLVIGSRYLDDATSADDDWLTAFGNWFFTRTVNLLHRAQYTDCMGILRVFRTTLIRELDLDQDASYRLPEALFGTIVSWEPLMSVRAAKRRKRIAEIPVSEPPRIGGHRKLQVFRWGAAYYFQFWRELWFWH